MARPAATTGTSGGSDVDFDVFLYNVDRGEGLYASQTADDVNEGFDVLIPEGWKGEYQVVLYWPDDADFCEAGEVENTAWTGWLKRASP